MKPIEKVQIANYIFFGILGFLGVYFMAEIAAFLQNLAVAVVSGSVILFIAYDHFVGKQRFKTLLEFLMAKAIGWLIELDPIAVAKLSLQDLYNKKEKVKSEGIVTVRNIQSSIKQTCLKEAGNYEKAEHEYNTTTDKTAKVLAKKKMDTITTFLEKYKAQSDKAAFFEKTLTDIYKALGFLYDYKNIELEYVEKDFLLAKSVTAVLRKALDIIKGETTNSGLYNQSLDYMQNFIANANVEADSMIADCSEFLKKIELGEVMDETKLVALEAKTNNFYNLITTEVEKSEQTIKK